MKDQEQIEIKADSSMEEIVQEFRRLKDKKKDLEKQAKDLNPQIETLQGLIITKMQGEGANKISTDFGSCSLSTKDYATIKDFAAFLEYIVGHGAYELIQKRANDAPMRIIWEEDEDVPGVVAFERTTLNFTRK